MKRIGTHFLTAGLTFTLAASAAAQAPVDSFTALSTQLKIDQNISVTTTDGERIRGKLLSITDGELRVRRARAFRRSEERSLTANAVAHVTVVDSEINGLLIGAGVGFATAAIWVAGGGFELSTPHMLGILGVPLALGGGAVGAAIDRAANRTVFDTRGTARLRVAPIVGRGIGLRASIQF